MEKTNTWSYFMTDNVDILFPQINNTWKKKIYNKTVAFAHEKIDEEIRQLTKEKIYNKFKISEEDKSKYLKWNMNVKIPELKELTNEEIYKKKINGNFLKSKYFVSCQITCKVTFTIY